MDSQVLLSNLPRFPILKDPYSSLYGLAILRGLMVAPNGYREDCSHRPCAIR